MKTRRRVCVLFLAESSLKASRSLDECDSSHDRVPHETRVHPSSGGETVGIPKKRRAPKSRMQVAAYESRIRLGNWSRTAASRIPRVCAFATRWKRRRPPWRDGTEDSEESTLGSRPLASIRANGCSLLPRGRKHLDVRWQMNMASLRLRTKASFVPPRSPMHRGESERTVGHAQPPNRDRGLTSSFERRT